MAQGGLHRRNKQKTKTTSPRRKSRELKNDQCSFSFLTLLDNATAFTTSKNNSGSKSSDCEHGPRYPTKRNGNGLLVIHTVKTCFKKALDYRMFSLDSTSSSTTTLSPRILDRYRNIWQHRSNHILLTSLIQFWIFYFCVILCYHVMPMKYKREQQCGSSIS